jgi:hypothetical protein
MSSPTPPTRVRRARKLRLRLGGDPADDEYPDKPPRMRWATYNRLIGCPRGTVARENKPEGQRTRPQQVQPDDDKREMALLRFCAACGG